jgi:hypothetical protein
MFRLMLCCWCEGTFPDCSCRLACYSTPCHRTAPCARLPAAGFTCVDARLCCRFCFCCRMFEYTVVSYFLLPTALLRVPLLGSLVAFPGAALGAYCLTDILSRRPSLRQAFDHLQ